MKKILNDDSGFTSVILGGVMIIAIAFFMLIGSTAYIPIRDNQIN